MLCWRKNESLSVDSNTSECSISESADMKKSRLRAYHVASFIIALMTCFHLLSHLLTRLNLHRHPQLDSEHLGCLRRRIKPSTQRLGAVKRSGWVLLLSVCSCSVLNDHRWTCFSLRRVKEESCISICSVRLLYIWTLTQVLCFYLFTESYSSCRSHRSCSFFD